MQGFYGLLSLQQMGTHFSICVLEFSNGSTDISLQFDLIVIVAFF